MTMKTMKITILFTLLTAYTIGCNPTQQKEIERPEQSAEEHTNVLKTYDSKVALIMKSIRSHKKSDAKMTDDLESEFTTLFQEAEELKKLIEEFSDDLSLEDYKLFERDNSSFREKKMEFESLKQNK